MSFAAEGPEATTASSAGFQLVPLQTVPMDGHLAAFDRISDREFATDETPEGTRIQVEDRRTGLGQPRLDCSQSPLVQYDAPLAPSGAVHLKSATLPRRRDYRRAAQRKTAPSKCSCTSKSSFTRGDRIFPKLCSMAYFDSRNSFPSSNSGQGKCGAAATVFVSSNSGSLREYAR